MTDVDAPVIVVGAGLAGTCAAHVLAARGIACILLDRNERYPEAFRAEKIEPFQAANLRKFGLLDLRVPLAGRMGTTLNYREGVLTEFDTVEQYGINYTDTVNHFRDHLRGKCAFIASRVIQIESGDTLQVVRTVDREYRARLVIVATGGSDKLIAPLGITRRQHPSLTSLSFAFMITPEQIADFTFSGLNYFLPPRADGTDYVTIFKIGDNMRVNLFTQWPLETRRLREFKEAPLEHMRGLFPDLERLIGSYAVTTKVQAYPTTFYRLTGTAKPGVVIIGDDYQSVSPATGTGLDKVTVDVDRLCNEYVPAWLATDGMGADKVRQYYADPAKRACDDGSLEQWIAYRFGQRGFVGRQLSRMEVRIKRVLRLW